MITNNVLKRKPCKRIIKDELGNEHRCSGVVEVKQIDVKNTISGTCVAQCNRCGGWYETWDDVRKLKAAKGIVDIPQKEVALRVAG